MAGVTLRNVRKSYGKVQVVHGVDLDVKAGEFLVLLGPSGCGKSTVLRMIAGLEEISAGDIAIDGTIVNRLEPRERGCAMVFQNYALYPHMSVAGNIGYSLKVAGVKAAERQAKVEAVARTVGLEDYLERKPAQLSGGQRQRVAMARAMIREPKVFLFDEPLSNLDAKLRVQMRIEIRKLHNRLGATSIFVTHDQIEAMTLADRLVVMNGGRIEQVGTPDEIYRRPSSVFVAGFVGSPPMNLLPGVVSRLDHIRVGGTEVAVQMTGLVTGQKVLVGLRPEEVAVATDSEGHSFEIEFVEQLGATRLLHGRFQEHPFVVQTTASDFGRADTMRFGIPADRIHLFDAETGARIESCTPVAMAAE